MSDQFTMQRADLAKKDKSELQTIIEALGGTSSARMKKDDLIDKVLELSGLTIESDKPVQQDLQLEGESATPADVAPPSEDGATPPSAASDTADAAPNDVGGDAVTPSGEKPEPKAKSAEGRKKKNGDQKSSGDKKPDDQNQQRKGSEQRNGGTKNVEAKSADSSDAESNAGSTDGEAEDSEGGNRRRRRRGRGRDNVADDPATQELVEVRGFLDLHDSGYGFLRVDGHRQSVNDVYVAVKMARTLELRPGDLVVGLSRPAQRNEKNPALQQVATVSGLDVEAAKDRPAFASLTPVYATENLVMERPDADDPTGRILDLVAPLAKGHRVLVVAPPKSGKTSLLSEVAASIVANHSEVSLFVVQIDERPEDATALARRVPEAEIITSPFGRPAEEHISAVALTIDRAKRLVETGNDVVVVVDGLSRLVRAHHVAGQNNSRANAGSIDAGAIYAAKRVLGEGRRAEEGGSLTVIGTINDASGGALDALILDEFVDGANVEIHLNRMLADFGVFPAVDVAQSGTRDRAMLMDDASHKAVDDLLNEVVGEDGIMNVDRDQTAPLLRLLAKVEASTSNADLIGG